MLLLPEATLEYGSVAVVMPDLVSHITSKSNFLFHSRSCLSSVLRGER